MGSVLIRGSGVAARCCSRLLAGSGLEVSAEAADRPRLPAIMVGETTQKLLSDVFRRPDLFHGMARISRRVVAWGPGAAPTEIPHSAIVLAESVLLDRIGSAPVAAHADAGWTILTSQPLPNHSFGSRFATVSKVKLRDGGGEDACWIESLEAGWTFLLPGGDGEGWLLTVGEADALTNSRLVARQIDRILGAAGRFACVPRIADPVCGPGWIACGTAAMGFDPLCGDGAGFAAREAILATAVIRASAAGGPADALLAHYRARITAAFRRHLEVCSQFYTTGGRDAWWQDQTNALQRGLEWCGNPADTFQFRLNGFDLEPVTGEPATPPHPRDSDPNAPRR